MKKYSIIYFLIMLPAILFAHVANRKANSVSLKAIASLGVKDSLKELKIGDKVPDYRINNIYNYSSGSCKISDFKGKLLILDFWATWCSPCIAMIPKMNSLQKEFGSKVQFLPINNQEQNVVIPFLKKFNKLKPFDLPDVLSDTIFNTVFPHTFLPHFVWIDTDGKVIAITSYDVLTSQNIQAVLSGTSLNLKLKKDNSLSENADKLFSDSSSNKAIIHKFIPGYQEDQPSEWNISPGGINGKSIEITNMIMADLFNIALGKGKVFFGRNRIVYDVKDTSVLTLDVKGDDAIDWMRKGHVYSYSIKTPKGMDDLAYEIMAQDLRNYFTNYDVAVENRQVKCLALIRTTSEDKLRSKGGKSTTAFDGISGHLANFPLGRLVLQLNTLYMYRSPYPVVDLTGYKDWVDLDINAQMSDAKAVNKELEKYGLKLELRMVPLDMLVIRDHKSPMN